MQESSNLIPVPVPLSLQVRDLDHLSYRAIFADARTVLMGFWPGIILSLLIAPPLIRTVDLMVLRSLFAVSDYQNEFILLVAQIFRCGFDSLIFVALAPALVAIERGVSGQSVKLADIFWRSRRVLLPLFIAGTIYMFIYYAGLFIPIISEPVWSAIRWLGEILLGTSYYDPMYSNLKFFIEFWLPFALGLIACSFIMLFAPAIIFENLGPLDALKRSAQLLYRQWWKLISLLVFVDLRLFPFDILTRILPLEISGPLYQFFFGTPLQSLSVVLGVVVYFNLVSIAARNRRCRDCGSESILTASELKNQSFLCPVCNEVNSWGPIQPSESS